MTTTPITTFDWPAASLRQWFNTPAPLSLAQLRGKVVVIGAFQMLCPACVAHSIPQLKKLHDLSQQLPLQVIGVHTVFEHHAAMQPVSLDAFVHEYRLGFPIAVDAHDAGNPIPRSMATWGLRGTPSTLVLTPNGELAFQQFGHVDDLAMGLVLGQLLAG